jgi:hypothetical protein
VKLIGCVPEAAQIKELNLMLHAESVTKILCITVWIREL